MAGSAVIGALRVVLGVDSAALDKGLNDARGSVSSFGSDMAKAGAVIAAAMTAAYGAVALSVNNTLQQMDSLGKQSQKIGIPVEQLSALTLAASTSGVGMDELGKGVGKLSKAMVEAAAKPMSEAANAFRALGVTATDSNGQLRPVIDVTTSIADKFAGMKDGAGKTAVSLALMGKTGNDLIPMLNMGADGLNAMMQNAAKFGIVIDGQAAAAATKFRDTLTLLGAAKDGLIVKLTQHMLPALQAFADIMLTAASNSDKQQTKLSFLSGSFDLLARAVLLVADNFKIVLQLGAIFVGASIGAAVISMGLAFAKLALSVYTTGVAMALFDVIRGASMKGLLLIGGIVAWAAGAFDNFSDKIKSMAENISSMLPEGGGAFMGLLKDLGINIRGLEVDLTKLGTDGAPKAAKGLTDFNYAAMGGKNAVDKFIDSTNKSIAAQQAELQTLGMAAGAKEALKVTLQGLEVATSAQIPINEALRAKLAEVSAAAGDMALKIQGGQLIQQNLAPLQAYTQELNNSTAAMVAAGASQEQLARNAQMVAEKFGSSAGAIGTSVAGTMGALSNLTGSFAKENKSMGIASKAFGIGQAIINTQIAVTKALATLPPPASYAAAALAVATGAASIATISMQKFKTGADFQVPGGIGGGDSVPFNAMLEPGERVKIEPNSYGASGQGDSGSGSRTLNLYAPAEQFGRETLRSIARGIEGLVGDGLKINLMPA
jgi:ribosomal protein L12E/L44/L45/RPP1/RPP2